MEGAFLPKGKNTSFALAQTDIELRRKTIVSQVPRKNKHIYGKH